MADKVRWGVLGCARIATTKVIPGMQAGSRTEVMAIASRDGEKARRVAAELGIAKAYGGYEELLADPDVEAVYIPLPNHLHVPWTVRAAEAGKHVLCEKPLGLTAGEARQLIAVRERTGVKIGDGFMVRTHPQWRRARDVARSGEIGDVRAVCTLFSYNNRDAGNIRNVPEFGGGGLMDIGCYAIQFARWIFGAEPERVAAAMEFDPVMGPDRLTSAVLEFAAGQAIFTCGTQIVPYQRTQILGTKGRIEVEIPVNAPPDRPTRIFVDDGTAVRTEEFAVCNQYTLQGDEFSRAIREGGEVPTPVEDGVANMAVIDAIVRAAKAGRWERLAPRPDDPLQ
jgi:predicted dehydrogenase